MLHTRFAFLAFFVLTPQWLAAKVFERIISCEGQKGCFDDKSDHVYDITIPSLVNETTVNLKATKFEKIEESYSMKLFIPDSKKIQFPGPNFNALYLPLVCAYVCNKLVFCVSFSIVGAKCHIFNKFPYKLTHRPNCEAFEVRFLKKKMFILIFLLNNEILFFKTNFYR